MHDSFVITSFVIDKEYDVDPVFFKCPIWILVFCVVYCTLLIVKVQQCTHRHTVQCTVEMILRRSGQKAEYGLECRNITEKQIRNRRCGTVNIKRPGIGTGDAFLFLIA